MMMQNRGYRKQHYNYLNLLILKPALSWNTDLTYEGIETRPKRV